MLCRAQNSCISLGKLLVSFLFCLAFFCIAPVGAWAADDVPEDEVSQESLNDLGEDNLINVQQTPDSSFLYDVSIADLCTSSVASQNNDVQVRGEVVGCSLRAEQNPGMYWITLNAVQGEKEGSISVLVSEEQLKVIDMYGEYGQRGTILSVRGTFHVACPSHEGIMDIHADSMSAVEAGYATPDTFSIIRFLPGLALCAIAFVLLVAYRSFAEGER